MRLLPFRVFTLALVFAVGAAVALAPWSAMAQTATSNPLKGIPITGQITDRQNPGGTFVGQMDIIHFSADEGKLIAHGRLTGDSKDASGAVIRHVDNHPVNWPVQAIQGTPMPVAQAIDETPSDAMAWIPWNSSVVRY